jgi:dTDP-4-dehydrorhamnose 3,5-epimerase
LPFAQGKLVRAVQGEILDVAVDVRRGSPTFGRWESSVLSAENKRQLWVPQGFAHGFFVLSESAEVVYKTTDYYHPEHEQCIRWDDPAIGIAWPLQGMTPLVSAKDAAGKPLASARVFEQGDLSR